MKINGMPAMLLAAAIAMGIGANAMAQPANNQHGSQHKYADDAIVRDLKAGKLTVREAQILRERRDHAVAKPVAQPVSPVRPARAGKHNKDAKAGKAAIHKQKSRAPIRRLTSPHGKSGVKPAHRQAAKTGKAVAGKPQPIRKTAVKYVR
jgi:hypothetical protein